MPPSRILVIDDELRIRDALGLVIRGLGYEVALAKNGEEAKEQLRGAPFDLIFTDLRLPDVSGIDLLALIKGDTPNTEVVVMTAHGSLDIAIEALKLAAVFSNYKHFPALSGAAPDQ